MRKRWFFLAPVFVAIFIAIGGFAVMYLWNWLAPALFGWHHITFWQAAGLLLLCRILFGRFGGGRGWRGGGGWRGKMAERWAQMTPEEREKFRQGWRGRCGGFAEPEGETKQPA